MQIGGGLMIFMQGRGGGAHKNYACILNNQLREWVRGGGGSAKKVLHKEEGQENLTMAPENLTLHWHQTSPAK